MDKEYKKLKTYGGLWGIALLLLFAILLSLLYHPKYGIEGVLKLQFSPDIDVFLQQAWNANDIRAHLRLDYIFIVCYTLLFILGVKVYELSIKTKFPLFVYLLCLLPGLIDVIENFAILNQLECPRNERNFSLIFWMVRLKWLTVISFVLINLVIFTFYAFSIIIKSIRFVSNLFKTKKSG